MTAEAQMCGAGDGLVEPGSGRIPGQTWWHNKPACQRARRQPDLPLVSACTNCAGEYWPRKADPLVSGLCGRRDCLKIRRRLERAIRQRAMQLLAQENPRRMAELSRQVAAQMAAETQERAA
ncbi:hypothetical protein FrEUN1fDRAFT_6708 [Parafrankia sp. EUN1f]|nr:hypothetical protein FrEUN1fDRAFT_6708 [Parafrankia sp. EUN1f]